MTLVTKHFSPQYWPVLWVHLLCGVTESSTSEYLKHDHVVALKCDKDVGVTLQRRNAVFHHKALEEYQPQWLFKSG